MAPPEELLPASSRLDETPDGATGRLGMDETGRLGMDATGRLGIDATGRLGIDATGRLGIDATGRLGTDATGRMLRTGPLFRANGFVAGAATFGRGFDAATFGRDVGLSTGAVGLRAGAAATGTFGRDVGLSTGAGTSASGASEPAAGVGRCRATGALEMIGERVGALLLAIAGETSLGAAGGMPFGALVVCAFDTVGATMGEVLFWTAEVFKANGAEDGTVAFDAVALFVIVGVAAGDKVTFVVFEVELPTTVAFEPAEVTADVSFLAMVLLLDMLPVGKRLGASLGVSLGCALGLVDCSNGVSLG
jgi:hypothetical protein